MQVPLERTGAIVVRIWLERPEVSGLRARITQTVDVSNPELFVTAAASPDEVCERVRAWINLFLAEQTGAA